MEIVVIRWKDSQAIEGWVSEDDAQDETPTECVTIGRYINRTKEYITVAPTRGVMNDKDALYLGVLTIPTGAIIDIQEYPLPETP